MHQNVSTWMGIIASCLDFAGPRNRVLSTDMNFPSVHYVWKEHERIGAKLDLVRSDDRITVDPSAGTTPAFVNGLQGDDVIRTGALPPPDAPPSGHLAA